MDHDVTVTRAIGRSSDAVWRALTDPALVRRWMMGATIRTTWRPGDTITWSGDMNGTAYTDHGEVLAVEPGRHLEYTHLSGAAGAAAVPHHVEWTLEPGDGGTHLTLVQTGARSALEAQQFRSGWQAMLDALAEVVTDDANTP